MIALDPSSKLQSNRSMWKHKNATGWLPDILLIILAKLPFKLGNVRVTRSHRLTIIHSVLNLMLVKLTFLSKLRALCPSAGECHRSLKRDLSSHHLTGVGTSMLLTRLSILLETRIAWTFFRGFQTFRHLMIWSYVLSDTKKMLVNCDTLWDFFRTFSTKFRHSLYHTTNTASMNLFHVGPFSKHID